MARHRVGFALKAAWLAHRMRPDRVILGHRNFLPMAPLLRLASRRSPQWLLTCGVDVYRRLNIVERQFLKGVDRVFAISPDTSRRLAEAGCRKPIELWPCSLPFYWPIPEETPPAFELPIRILTVSRLAPPTATRGSTPLSRRSER
jgi:Glycosyltransferase Family 4